MLFTTSHSVILLTFAVTVVFAGIKVFELRTTSASYNARLFTFGYLSLFAWILWIFQYAILVGPFLSLPTGLPVDALSLTLIQNAFWACAVLSLHLKQFSRKSLTLPFLAVFSVATILVAYLTPLTSPQLAQFIAPIEGASTATIFIVLGVSIVQLGLSKVSAAIFLIHGFSQWLWTGPWLPLFSTTPIVHLAFPLWRVALLIAWFRLIAEMGQRVKPLLRLVPLRVMISSTHDLRDEREAADIAIGELQLDRFRAETFGSVPHSPEVICELLAEQCDIFVLILGERYGYVMSDGRSVVEFEYSVARKKNRDKILAYVKQDVVREPLQEEFCRRVEDFETGHFRSFFKAADDLRPKIRGDIVRWLASRRNE